MHNLTISTDIKSFVPIAHSTLLAMWLFKDRNCGVLKFGLKEDSNNVTERLRLIQACKGLKPILQDKLTKFESLHGRATLSSLDSSSKKQHYNKTFDEFFKGELTVSINRQKRIATISI